MGVDGNGVFFVSFFLLEREADVAVEGGGGEMSGLWSDQ